MRYHIKPATDGNAMGQNKKCKLGAVDKALGRAFSEYGKFLFDHRKIFLVAPLVISCALGLGFLALRFERDIETLYTPQGSRASVDRRRVTETFPQKSASNFYSYKLTRFGLFGEVIFEDGTSVTGDSLERIRNLTYRIKSISIQQNGPLYIYKDLCALTENSCVVEGKYLTTPEFKSDLLAGNVSYPFYTDHNGEQHDLRQNVAEPTVENGTLRSMKAIRLTFYLRDETMADKSRAAAWEEAFLRFMERQSISPADLAYQVSDSMNSELDKSTTGDIIWISLTFTAMITYVSIVSEDCGCFSARANLARFGVVAVALAIVAAFGLLCACGLKFVNIAGVAPFLVLGKGIDDMFVLLAGLPDKFSSPRDQVGKMLESSGAAITVTTLTDIVAFGVGASSSYISIRNFSIYTGLTLLFCYINMVTSFSALVAIYYDYYDKNEQDGHTTSGKSEEDENQETTTVPLEYEGHAVHEKVSCYGNHLTDYNIGDTSSNNVYGDGTNDCEAMSNKVLTKDPTTELNPHKPLRKQLKTHQEAIEASAKDAVIENNIKGGISSNGSIINSSDSTSTKAKCLCKNNLPGYNKMGCSCEMNFRKNFPKVVVNNISRPIIIIFFLGLLGLSIWGTTQMKEGLDLKNLASDDSYWRKFANWNSKYFASRGPIIQIVVTRPLKYWEKATEQNIEKLIKSAQATSYVLDDFSLSWVHSFRRYLNITRRTNVSRVGYLTILREEFLPFSPLFETDVVFNQDNSSILSSRIYVQGAGDDDSKFQGHMMVSIRDVMSASGLPVFAFSAPFIFFEQYVTILPNTLQTCGVAIAAMFVIALIFIPHPLSAVYVTVTMVMILVSMLGFMHFWDLTLSSITMIQIVLSIGFSVDFSAHICHAFMTAEDAGRKTRAMKALEKIAGPILNGALSSIIGVLFLVFARSYTFQSFFRTMFLVVLFGVTHALLFLPAVLSFIGPGQTLY